MLFGEIIENIYGLLLKHYGTQEDMFSHPPFRMMLTALLKDSASWDNLKKTLDILGEYNSPEEITRVPFDKIAAGLSLCSEPDRTARLLNIFLTKLRTWGYMPEDYAHYDFDELRTLFMNEIISRESAVDFILLYVFDFPTCAVDADVKKLILRIYPDSGFEKLSHVALAKTISDSFNGDISILKELCMLLLRVTKEHCFQTHPACRTCPLLYICASAGEF